LPELSAGIGHRGAIQVGGGRRGGGRGVGHFVGTGRHDADGFDGQPQAFGRDLPDLGVEALPHLRAAVVHLHAAIAVDEHQRAALIEEGGGERDSELDRGDRHAAFAVRMRRVEALDLFPPLREPAGFQELAPDGLDTRGIFHGLPVMGGVALAIEIALAHHFGRQAERARGAVQNVFDDQHALGAAEAAKGGLRGFVGSADVSGDFHGWQVVSVVEVEHGAPEHGFGKIEAPAAVGIERYGEVL
jgi:hypothetical protein